MSAAVCGKRSSSFFEEAAHAAASPSPSKRARFRSATLSWPPHPRPAADPDLVAALTARFPSVSLEFIEKALEECENNIDAAIKRLYNLDLVPTGGNIVDPVCQSPNAMSADVQMPEEGIWDGNKVTVPTECVPRADNFPSSNTEWIEILVNAMASVSNMDDLRTHASRVLEVFEKSVISRNGLEAMHNFQKENSMYKEQLETLMRENTILKKAVAIQHERQKEHDEKSQELHQLKQLVSQYQEQIRNLEVNNYALSMHLKQAQQGSSIPGHFHRDIF